MEKMVISVQELSDTMGISLPKAYELTKLSDFPVIRVGTRKLIPTTELRAWLSRAAHGAVITDQ